MNNFNIVYKKCGKYSAVIYPTSYLNPVYDVKSISKELRKHLEADSYILFDLLLSNGNSFNRFAETFYAGREITDKDICIAKVSPSETRLLNSYYKGKVKELSNSALSEKEQFRYAMYKENY